jgi:hypothetical protein
MADADFETRQERREQKLRKKKARIAQSGKSLVKIYTDSVLKHAKGK